MHSPARAFSVLGLESSLECKLEMKKTEILCKDYLFLFFLSFLPSLPSHSSHPLCFIFVFLFFFRLFFFFFCLSSRLFLTWWKTWRFPDVVDDDKEGADEDKPQHIGMEDWEWRGRVDTWPAGVNDKKADLLCLLNVPFNRRWIYCSTVRISS